MWYCGDGRPVAAVVPMEAAMQRSELGIMIRRTHPRVQDAIRKLGLTRRQEEIVAALALGMPHDQIADALKITRSTLRSHFRHIFTSVSVGNRVELLARVLDLVLREADADHDAGGHFFQVVSD